MRASVQSVNATPEAERGRRSIAENSPKMPPPETSLKITSRPASVKLVTRTVPDRMKKTSVVFS